MKTTIRMILAAVMLITLLPVPACAEAGDEDMVVTVVTAPEQTKAERPPCFPDPADQYIMLPETENIAQGKPIEASLHNDVYVSANLNDGNTNTYWESKGFPAELTVDLQGTYTISTAAFCLNTSAIWEPRTQEITVLVSTDGENFTEVLPAAAYTFDAETGNRVRIDFEPVQATHVRVIITSNTAAPAHAKGAQLAEICIYGE